MKPADVMTLALVVVGAGFFLAGTAGLLRFPDTYSRLHALTKADNLGLGFIVVGLALASASLLAALKLIVVWVLVLLSSSGVCYLVARTKLKWTSGGRDADSPHTPSSGNR